MMDSSENPLFLGILFVLGGLSGGDKAGNWVIFWGLLNGVRDYVEK